MTNPPSNTEIKLCSAAEEDTIGRIWHDKCLTVNDDWFCAVNIGGGTIDTAWILTRITLQIWNLLHGSYAEQECSVAVCNFTATNESEEIVVNQHN